MSKLEQQWIEAFRAGDYGDKGQYDASDLDRIVANYNPARHEAPAVIGHPENDAPAFGWVEGLKREGDVLFAKLKQVSPQLDQLVESGAFKKRSISLYREPLSLRHLGFLGAMPPEVKGLADLKLCEFRDGNREHQAIDFNQESDMEKDEMKKTFMEGMKEFFASGFRPEKTESKSFSEEDVKRISGEVAKVATKEISDKLEKTSKEFSEFKTKVEEFEKSSKLSGRAGELVGKLKEAKKWIPAFDKMGVPQIFTELVKSEATISFGEGDKKVEKPVADVFAEFLGGLPELVPGGEISKAAAAARKGNLIKFTEPKSAGYEIDQQSVALGEAAQKMVDEDKTGKLQFGEALKIARRQMGSDEGSAAAGAV